MSFSNTVSCVMGTNMVTSRRRSKQKAEERIHNVVS